MAHFMKVAEASPSLVPAEILGYKFEDWVADAIGATMALTYQGGDKMDTEFRSQFDADFSVLMDHYGIAETETQEERQAQLVHQMSLLMAQSAGALNDLLVATTGRGDLVHRIANLWSRSATGMSPRTMVALRGVFTSSLVSFLKSNVLQFSYPVSCVWWKREQIDGEEEEKKRKG